MTRSTAVAFRDITYRSEPIPSVELVRAIRGRAQRVLCFNVPTDYELTTQTFERLLKRVIRDRFPAELIERFHHCSEVIYNALRYGRPNSEAEFLLLLMGRRHSKLCVLVIENELGPALPLGLPSRRRCRRFSKGSVLETHGRGIKLLCLHADGLSVRLYPSIGRIKTIVTFVPRTHVRTPV